MDLKNATVGNDISMRMAQAHICTITLYVLVKPKTANKTRGISISIHRVDLIINECVCMFVLVAEECAGGATPGEEECPPVIVSWEGSADIQIGDILIVRISDSLLLDSFGQHLEVKNITLDANNSHTDNGRSVFIYSNKNTLS